MGSGSSRRGSGRGNRPGVLAAAFAAALWVLAGIGAPALADEVDDEVAAITALLKDGPEGTLLPKVTSLEKKRDKRLDAALLDVAQCPRFDAAAKEAMRILALHKDATYLGWARSKLKDKGMLESRPGRYFAMLDSLPHAGDALKPMLPSLEGAIEDWMKKNSELTAKVCAACAAIRDKAVPPRLILLIQEVEKSSSGGGGGGGGGGSKPAPPPGRFSGGGGDQSQETNLQVTKQALIAALKSLTGGDGGNWEQWHVWWAEHEAKLKIPPSEPDWPMLTEFFEYQSGLVLRKPARTWAFEKSPFIGSGARLKLEEGKVVTAAVDVNTYPKGSWEDVDAYARYLADSWGGSQFTGFDAGGDPALAKKKIAGREFVVVSAHGLGVNQTREWDRHERRCYVTMADPETILCIEGFARDGIDPAQKAALWAHIESVTFKPVK